MSRSGYYYYEGNGWELALYRGRVASATRGKRGQQLFKDLVVALDAMPNKRLVARELESATGEVCALGAVGQMRGIEGVRELDPEDSGRVADTFNIAECLAREIVFENDENGHSLRYRETICRRCHGWGEQTGVRGRPARCQSCNSFGRHHHVVPETPEARWARMRAWAVSQIKPEPVDA